MSRKKPAKTPKHAAWWSGTLELSHWKTAALREVCDLDDFVSVIADIAGSASGEGDFWFPAAANQKKGCVQPGQYRAALRILAKGGKRAMDLFPNLDWRTRDLLKLQAWRMYDAPEDFDNWAYQHPDLLARAAKQLLDDDPGKTRYKFETMPGKNAAFQLRQLFMHHNLKFTTYVGETSKTYDGGKTYVSLPRGKAARCLYIILGTKKNLKSYLEEALKYFLP